MRLISNQWMPMSFYSIPFQFALYISDNKSFSPAWVNNESLVNVNNLLHNPWGIIFWSLSVSITLYCFRYAEINNAHNPLKMLATMNIWTIKKSFFAVMGNGVTEIVSIKNIMFLIMILKLKPTMDGQWKEFMTGHLWDDILLNLPFTKLLRRCPAINCVGGGRQGRI